MALDETKKCGCGCDNNTIVTKPSSGKKIIYYKLNSPYREDYTKNCGLVGSEIDQNFFNLKEMDIIRADWDSSAREIVLTRVDGEEIRVKGLYDTINADFKEFDFSYNPNSGTLLVTTPLEKFEIKGFFTDDKLAMANDDTLVGDGCMSNPLGVASVARTGTYRPVNAIIDAVEGESTEITLNKLKPVKGDRFITVENIGKFGRLYDYNGVEKLMSDLKNISSEWRVPTKTDWDVMLTCVEGCVYGDHKEKWHDSIQSNVYLGQAAGQRLRTQDHWEKFEQGETPVGYDSDYTYSTEGTDAFGFSVLPLGYGDENSNSSKGYGRYSAFWTSTREDKHNDMYTKRFNYNKNNVYQASTEPTERLSLRLVKTFNGKNFDDTEVINGMTYPCVLITVPSDIKDETIYSVDKEKNTELYATVWTQINIGFNNPDYLPKTNIVDSEWDGKDNNNIRYFINDFDGQKWTKHELKNGESVVVIGEYNGVEMHEWRIVDGVLVDTVNIIKTELENIFNERFDEVHDKIDAEIERATTEDIRLEAKIDTEIERSSSADIDLKNDIKNEVEDRQKGDDILHSKLNFEFERATAEEARLDGRIDDEIKRATAEEARLDGKIDVEIERATTAEGELNAKIDAEIKRATTEEARLEAKIDTEIERSTAADIDLKNDLKQESKERQEEDDKLGIRIDDEIKRATAEEARLEKKIDDEIERATAEEGRIEGKFDGEVLRLDGRIDDEIARATAEEARLDGKIDTEVLRLDGRIDNEIARATAEEARLDGKIDTEVLRLDGRIDDEIENRIANDIKTGDYLFSVNGGVIETNGKNIPNVKFTFDFNFGELPEYTPINVTE